VAEVLELAELAEHDREAEVDVGRCRIDAELHPQGFAGRDRPLDAAAQIGPGDDVDAPGRQDPHLLVDRHAHRWLHTASTLPSALLTTGEAGGQQCCR
jgi:hypothetical protein